MRAPKPRNLIRTQLGVCLAAACLFPAASSRAATPGRHGNPQLSRRAMPRLHHGVGHDLQRGGHDCPPSHPQFALPPPPPAAPRRPGRTYYFAGCRGTAKDRDRGRGASLSASSSEGWPIILYRDADGQRTNGGISTGQLAAGGELPVLRGRLVRRHQHRRSTVTVLTFPTAAAPPAGSGQSGSERRGWLPAARGRPGRGRGRGGRSTAPRPCASTKTSSSGAFLLTGLPAGSYDVEISGPDMAPRVGYNRLESPWTVRPLWTATLASHASPRFRGRPADGHFPSATATAIRRSSPASGAEAGVVREPATGAHSC